MTAEATGIGGELARAREARGLALADVAQSLKFAPRQLEALEQERFDLLPGGTFARGMVRSYARLLKLDPEPLVSRLGEAPVASNTGRLAERYREPVPFSDNARRSTLIYLGLSLVVLLAAAAFAYEWMRERTVARKAPAAAAVARTPPKAAPRPVVESAPVLVIEKAVVEKKAEAPKKPEALAKPASGVHRLVLRIEREAWIEVRDGAERLLISSLNPGGTERVVQGRPPFSLVIGNAQHVRVIYDDRPVDLQPYVKVEVARLTLQ
ncbi:MAG TPA: RodZ domain-containing protein [Burkholderiales bacterium]